MIEPYSNKLVIITSLNQDTLYVNDAYCKLHKKQSHEILAKPTPQFIDYPLGFGMMYQDCENFQEDAALAVERPVILITDTAFLLGTIRKSALMDNQRVIGVVKEMDFSMTQIPENTIFNNLNKYTFQCEEFSSLDLKMLILLTQYKNIKSRKVAEILGVKPHTAYVYKHNLLSKLNVPEIKDTHERDIIQSILLDLFTIHPQIENTNYLPFPEVQNKGFLKCKAA